MRNKENDVHQLPQNSYKRLTAVAQLTVAPGRQFTSQISLVFGICIAQYKCQERRE